MGPAYFRKRAVFARKHLVLGALIFGLAWLLGTVQVLHSDSFTFYLSDQRHVVPSQTIGGAEYLPVLDVLNVVGKVTGWQEKRNSIRIWFGGSQLELHLDKNNVKLGKTEFSLSHPVRIANGQWVVPSDFLISILPQLIGQPVGYTLGSKSAFIGEGKPLSYSLRLDPIPNGARLTLEFTGPVAIRTVSQNGKWILYLGNNPVQSPQQVYRFASPYISEVQFDDHDGAPKLIVTPGTDGLNFYAMTLGRGGTGGAGPGKSIVAEVVKPPSAPAALQPGAPAPPAPSPAMPQPAAPPAPPHPASALPVVAVDAGHGGPDSGARSSNGVLEKDLVAQLGERLRTDLLATQKYRVVETRPGDSDPNFDDRASTANASHPIAFISLHAGSFGEVTPHIAVYSYSASSRAAPPGAKAFATEPSSRRVGPRRLLVPWDQIQESHLERSRQLAQALAEQFGKIPGITTQQPTDAPVRVLRSVDAPAVAIELGSLSPGMEAGPLTDLGFRQQISAAVVQAIQAFQGGHP
jgi:N-acetylmuramoyl-L-alanine amidase